MLEEKELTLRMNEAIEWIKDYVEKLKQKEVLLI